MAFVTEHRNSRPIVIDSHAVTKEEYGYRITPFSLDQFACLAPDEIWVLFASPEATRARIAADAAGRPMVSEEEVRVHTALQASVAATYGMSLGRPVYLFDTVAPRDELVDRLGGAWHEQAATMGRRPGPRRRPDSEEVSIPCSGRAPAR